MRNMRRWLIGASVVLAAFVLLPGGCVKSSPAEPVPVDSVGVKNITPQQAFELIKAHKGDANFVIIDDQPSAQFEKLHISDAVNISLSIVDDTSFRNQVSGLDKNKIYLTYCPTGCGASARIMRELGFQEVYNMTGGLKRWVEEGLPALGTAIQ